jgi:hypothetical protein
MRDAKKLVIRLRVRTSSPLPMTIAEFVKIGLSQSRRTLIRGRYR